jgi:hypothetical protein
MSDKNDGGPAFPMPSGPEPRVEAAREYREAPATSARYALDALFAALDAAEGT